MQQAITCIVLIGDTLFKTVNSFHHAWFQWEYEGIQRISHFPDETTAKATLIDLCRKNYQVIVVWDKPTGTGIELNIPELQTIMPVFRESLPIEVDQLLCRPDEAIETAWDNWDNQQRPWPYETPTSLSFRQAYTSGLKQWVLSLPLAYQKVFNRFIGNDVTDIWALWDDGSIPSIDKGGVPVKTEKTPEDGKIIYFPAKPSKLVQDQNDQETGSLQPIQYAKKEAASNADNTGLTIQEIDLDRWEKTFESLGLKAFLDYANKTNSFFIRLESLKPSVLNTQFEIRIVIGDEVFAGCEINMTKETVRKKLQRLTAVKPSPLDEIDIEVH